MEVVGTATAFKQELARTKYSIYFIIRDLHKKREHRTSQFSPYLKVLSFKRTLSQKKTATSVIFSNKTTTIQSHLYKSENIAEMNIFKTRLADLDKLD